MGQERLVRFADEIESMDEPLGADFDTGCWGARAFVIAADAGQHPCDYFGISPEQLLDAITINSETPPGQRNEVMARRSRELAEMAA